MNNLKIEKVGDINSKYSYLEIFIAGSLSPFLEVGISDEEQLVYKFYPMTVDFSLTSDEWDEISSKSKDFLNQELKDEQDFLKLKDSLEE